MKIAACNSATWKLKTITTTETHTQTHLNVQLDKNKCKIENKITTIWEMGTQNFVVSLFCTE